jgi:hypothetical protein
VARRWYSRVSMRRPVSSALNGAVVSSGCPLLDQRRFWTGRRTGRGRRLPPAEQSTSLPVGTAEPLSEWTQ